MRSFGEPMKHRSALVVGYGSIGARHARLLSEAGCHVAVVSSRAIDFPTTYTNIDSALRRQRPDYIVIANETNRHHATLMCLADACYEGVVLVEKPLFDDVKSVPAHRFVNACVAYNLRFHPVIQQLRDALVGQEVISVQAYVGQYLPEWRPGTDYRNCYSAIAERGGGVLLDLSHDLDYLGWILGPWMTVAAIGGQMSKLEIDSDDVFLLLAQTERCHAVAVQLNYLDRRGRRRLIVNTANHTYEADLVRNVLVVDREEKAFEIERDTTYRAMHAALLQGDVTQACSLQNAMQTLSLIKAIRAAACQRKWIQV